MTTKGTCSVEGCEKKILCRGWCNMHYCRWRNHGDVLYPVEKQVHGGTVLDRYWAKVDKSRGSDSCWLWLGVCQRYGIFWGGEHRPDGSPIMVKAHRWTYEQFVGPIDDLHVCHTCDNPPCVNPAHLFLGSHKDNMGDMTTKGRGAPPSPQFLAAGTKRGTANGSAKLTEDQVREIRTRYVPRVVSQQSLADEYGVNQTIISAIVNRKLWTHI